MMEHLRIAVVGNFNPPDSGVDYQAEVLADHFVLEGAFVTRVTFQQNRYIRPAATAALLLSRAPQYDVVCVQAFSFGNWINAAIAISIGKMLRKRVVVVYRGGGFSEFVRKYEHSVLPFLRRADKVIVPSGFLQREMTAYAITAEVIPNVITLGDWASPPRAREAPKPRLLWVRHLRRGYNPWMAVQTLRIVQQHYPEATLKMAGDGPLKDELKRRVQYEQVSGVTLLGHLSSRKLRSHYHEADIFINTTNYDNQPRSVLEAMASGLPVVSTDVGGLPFLITHCVDGLLVPKNNAGHMADAVLRLIRDAELAIRLREGALNLVQLHTWAANKRKWARVLSQTSKVARP